MTLGITDVGKETGGIILIHNDVRDVVTAIRISRATLRTIKQNRLWAVVYNAIGLPIAALGFVNPLLSSLSVVSEHVSNPGGESQSPTGASIDACATLGRLGWDCVSPWRGLLA